MLTLPSEFENRMRMLLGEAEYEEFRASYEKPRARGLRLNPLKLPAEWECSEGGNSGESGGDRPFDAQAAPGLSLGRSACKGTGDTGEFSSSSHSVGILWLLLSGGGEARQIAAA